MTAIDREQALAALDPAIEYLTGEYDEDFPMVERLVKLRAALPAIPLDEIEVRLVPVEVFGAGCDETDHEGGYGLCDAVEAWSDCNRAYGHIFRFDDDFQIGYRKPGETLAVRVNAAEYEAFAATRWGQDDDEERDRLRSQHPEFDSGALPVLETKKETP